LPARAHSGYVFANKVQGLCVDGAARGRMDRIYRAFLAEPIFLKTHGAAMIAAMVGWFVCALFASVAFNWTFYYLLGLSVAARDVVRARALAYADAQRRGETRAVAA
jgi:hypothetical protein